MTTLTRRTRGRSALVKSQGRRMCSPSRFSTISHRTGATSLQRCRPRSRPRTLWGSARSPTLCSRTSGSSYSRRSSQKGRSSNAGVALSPWLGVLRGSPGRPPCQRRPRGSAGLATSPLPPACSPTSSGCKTSTTLRSCRGRSRPGRGGSDGWSLRRTLWLRPSPRSPRARGPSTSSSTRWTPTRPAMRSRRWRRRRRRPRGSTGPTACPGILRTLSRTACGWGTASAPSRSSCPRTGRGASCGVSRTRAGAWRSASTGRRWGARAT
mmetsp:Transcript_21215/g.67150  ORF Transcript_21215/g.67150 Transcript_21215/m.67150 type:complete len:267 (-) Transcript_21215:368-1168(-)